MLISANNGGVGKCTIPPTANAAISCATNGAPGADVAVTNPDDDDVAHVNILKGTTVIAANVAIPTLSAIHQPVPFGNGETATLSVVDLATGTTIFTKPFTANCTVPTTPAATAAGTAAAPAESTSRSDQRHCPGGIRTSP